MGGEVEDDTEVIFATDGGMNGINDEDSLAEGVMSEEQRGREWKWRSQF